LHIVPGSVLLHSRWAWAMLCCGGTEDHAAVVSKLSRYCCQRHQDCQPRHYCCLSHINKVSARHK
jgi:hypothetical protein